MNGSRLWLAAAALYALLLTASCAHHRRIMATQATLPVSKGGWRPVVGSGGLLYGSFGTAPLHAPQYKIPVPVLDMYQSSARPLASRDAPKLTSIAQSYRPTTHRTVPTSQQSPIHQPINSYHNPFAIQNNGLLQNAGFNLQNGLNYYKHVQNYPMDSVLIRNPHNPYAARPIFQKYPNRFKQQQLQNNVLQQLTSIQPLQFAQYQTNKPLDIFGNPVESYARPTENKNEQSGGTEIYKQELYKLPDSDTASQSVSQQVKTAQQTLGAHNQIYSPYGPYAFQDTALPPTILGSFGNYGLQSVKGQNIFPPTKTTFFPQHPTKQTIFNSFSYNPNYKTTPLVFSSTTPRLHTTPNQVQFSSTYSDYTITPIPNTKVSTPPKIDPNAGAKVSFKPSPQDPFSKNYHGNDFNKIIATTYNPLQTTANNVYEYSFQAQNIGQNQYYDQKNINYDFDKKQKIHDSVSAGGNQQVTKQYANPPRVQLDGTIRPTYEVIETTDADVITHSSPAPWSLTSQPMPYDNLKSTEEAPKKHEYTDYSLQDATPLPAFPEEYAIVTEAEKGYDNSLNYDGHVESQSRRPLGDDFEQIGKHKQNNYYSYKVSTPSYDDIAVPRRTNKPTTESGRPSTQEATTAGVDSDVPVEALPTLPPYKHFKRPATPEPSTMDKDRIRKRTKIRRRRPPLAQLNRNRQETSTRASTVPTEASPTEADEIHTIKPRVRPSNVNLQSAPTTVSISTDLTTSALPTVTPTSPTLIKKKLAHRRLITTTPAERLETTTTPSVKVYEANKESQIMKIANRQQYKSTSAPYETPDYSHKQDEKDTPTSDVAVSLNDGLRTTAGTEPGLEFAFHKDVKPIEGNLEPMSNRFRETTTESEASNEVTTSLIGAGAENPNRAPRPRLRNKYNRPKFSVKDYKSRLGSTTTTEQPVENTPKLRFPQRRIPYTESDTETTTERKKFTPKDPRHKANNAEPSENEREYYVRPSIRQRQTTQAEENTTKISARIRNGSRRTKPMDETTETLQTTVHAKRPLRKKIKDSDIGESVQDISVTETTIYDPKEITSERTRSESAIMKIADKKHQDHVENLFEHSKRVSDLTLAASKDYNKPGMFKSVPTNSRRIPNYFTIATDDPILPIEAFFPQLNQKKET